MMPPLCQAAVTGPARLVHPAQNVRSDSAEVKFVSCIGKRPCDSFAPPRTASGTHKVTEAIRESLQLHFDLQRMPHFAMGSRAKARGLGKRCSSLMSRRPGPVALR